MTVKDRTRGTTDLKALVVSDPDFVRVLVRMVLQEVLEAEMKRETPVRRRANAPWVGWVTGPATTAGRWSRGSAGGAAGAARP